jgi:hypothetical protein
MDWAPLPATRAPTPTRQHRMHPRPLSACLDTCKHQLASSPASMPGLSHPILHQPVQGTRGRREDRSEAKDPSSRPRSHGQDVLSSPPFAYSLRTHESSAAIVQSAVQRPCFQQGAVTSAHLAGYGGVLKLKRRGSRNTASARPRPWSGRKVLEKTLVRQRPLSSIVESDLKRRANRAGGL